MKVILSLGLLLLSSASFAWGPIGHRVVGEIAERHLSPTAKKKAMNLLDGESLARVSNWPDKIKSDKEKYGHTFKWHYTDWADTSVEYDRLNNSGTLVEAIEKNFKVLRDIKFNKKDRAFALKFLVHLVGDVHQPLHVGNGYDRGSNNCRVTFHEEETNLHRLWDEGLIRFTKLSFSEYANFINIKKNYKNISIGSPVSWAKESAEQRKELYPPEVSPVASKSPHPIKNYCDRELNLPKEQLPKLGYRYSYKLLPLMEKRMVEAGIRLAYLINKAL